MVLADADVDALADVEVAVCAEGEGSVVAVGDFEVLAVDVLGVGSLVGLGVALVELLAVVVGVGVGVAVESGTAWHCCALAPALADVATVAVSSAGWADDAAAENPVAAAARTPPATRPISTGCTCAKRMRGPVRCCSGTNHSVWSGYFRRGKPCSCRTHTIGHQSRYPVLVHSYPPSANDHAGTWMIWPLVCSWNSLPPNTVTLGDVCHCWVLGDFDIRHVHMKFTECS